AFKDTGKTPMELEVAIHRIQIILTSCNIKSLEKMLKGSVRMPTKTLRITTRKICGQGSKTQECFHRRIHKQLIDLHSPSEIKQITSISTDHHYRCLSQLF
uniref:Small ribosomal subunit protein uS10 domain-containing protein n=1 Tax=Colobus angolensis palliatus TaxID=336983 RepID=A0A2K5J479_COLAP